jgi:hypothetical protein
MVEDIEAMEHFVCCEELTEIGRRRRFDVGCWTLELADAAATPLGRRYAFYAIVDGRRIDLIPAEHGDGSPYLVPLDPTADADALALPRLEEPYARPVSAR